VINKCIKRLAHIGRYEATLNERDNTLFMADQNLDGMFLTVELPYFNTVVAKPDIKSAHIVKESKKQKKTRKNTAIVVDATLAENAGKKKYNSRRTRRRT
jgi:hypothetical protein